MKRLEIAASAALFLAAASVPFAASAATSLRCTFGGETVEWPDLPLPAVFAEKSGAIECRDPADDSVVRKMEISGGKPVFITETEDKTRTDQRYSPLGVKQKEVRYAFSDNLSAWHVVREQTFNDAGKLVRDFRYEAGRPVLDEQFDADGKLREKTEYRKVAIGFEIYKTHYHENGAIAATGMSLRKRGFGSQLPQGSFKKYDLRGQLVSEKVFDEEGAPIRERAWDAEGKLIRDEAIEVQKKPLMFKNARGEAEKSSDTGKEKNAQDEEKEVPAKSAAGEKTADEKQ